MRRLNFLADEPWDGVQDDRRVRLSSSLGANPNASPEPSITKGSRQRQHGEAERYAKTIRELGELLATSCITSSGSSALWQRATGDAAA
jgi:hypothetical protein